jgi:LmbE family N-acetylglucosaminyl deacetylase
VAEIVPNTQPTFAKRSLRSRLRLAGRVSRTSSKLSTAARSAKVGRGRGFLDGLNPDVSSTSPEMVAVTFDATRYLERKLSVLTAHQSAFGVTADTLKNPSPTGAQMLRAFQPFLEREVFVLGATRGPVPRWPLADFFDGLETADLREAGGTALPHAR